MKAESSKYVSHELISGSYSCEQVRGSSQPVGTLNFHFVRRAWDARLKVNSCEPLHHDYRKEARCIIDNLKICPSSAFEGLSLSTQTTDQDFRILSVILKRTTTHTSPMYPDLLLHLCENQDLGVNQVHVHSQTDYRGSIGPHEHMVATNRLWWESWLSSISAAAALRDNATLECGKQATCEPRNFTHGGTISDMISLATDIVTRIDNVGMHKEGLSGAISGSKTAVETSEKTRELPTGKRGFW